MQAVCVFCGSSSGHDPLHLETARALGRELAERGLTLVYGGAGVGLMGAIADQVLSAGGEVIGVIPDLLTQPEIAHAGLTRLETVPTMAARKTRMIELADACISLPGGIGTLDEIFEIWALTALGVKQCPHALLDPTDFYRPLRRQLDDMVSAGFLRPAWRRMLLVDREPGRLLDRLAAGG